MPVHAPATNPQIKRPHNTIMTIATPKPVADAISKLDAADREAVDAFIGELKGTIADLKGEESPQDIPAAASADGFSNDEEADGEDDNGNEPPFPPMYESGEDYDKASDLKMAANDLKSNGDLEGALAKYSEAVQAAEPSALLYANRADCLLKLGRPRAAVNDCNAALEMNPDSAKALRIRGTAHKDLGKYEEALKDLSASQAIDYNDSAAEALKFCTEKHMEHEKELAKKRNEEKDKLRKKAEEIKKAQEEAKREAAASASARASAGGMGGGMPDFGGGGMPGGGMPGGGMGGMPGGLGGLMNDPELMAALSNPKVMAAMQGMMSGGAPDMAKMQELMSDPEVGPAMQKLMEKMGPMMGGMGGMGGMPGGGMPGGGFSAGGAGDDESDDDDMPDLDDLPDLE